MQVIIPINQNNTHWFAACINFRDKRTEVYDSMGGRHEPVHAALRQYDPLNSAPSALNPKNEVHGQSDPLNSAPSTLNPENEVRGQLCRTILTLSTCPCLRYQTSLQLVSSSCQHLLSKP